MLKRILTYSIVFAASALLSAQAYAVTEGTSETSFDHVRGTEGRSEYEPHVGVLAGYSDLNGNPSQDLSYLVEVGFQPTFPLQLGLQWQYAPGQIELPGADIDYDTWGLYAKGVATLGGDIPFVRHVFVGGKTGVLVYDGPFDSETHFAIGPTAGFDIPINPGGTFTLGAEGTYLGVLGDDLDTPDQTTILGAAKFFF